MRSLSSGSLCLTLCPRRRVCDQAQVLVLGVFSTIAYVMLTSNSKKSRRTKRSEPATYREGEHADEFLKRTVMPLRNRSSFHTRSHPHSPRPSLVLLFARSVDPTQPSPSHVTQLASV